MKYVEFCPIIYHFLHEFGRLAKPNNEAQSRVLIAYPPSYRRGLTQCYREHPFYRYAQYAQGARAGHADLL
jgi:hypothetical protein